MSASPLSPPPHSTEAGPSMGLVSFFVVHFLSDRRPSSGCRQRSTLSVWLILSARCPTHRDAIPTLGKRLTPRAVFFLERGALASQPFFVNPQNAQLPFGPLTDVIWLAQPSPVLWHRIPLHLPLIRWLTRSNPPQFPGTAPAPPASPPRSRRPAHPARAGRRYPPATRRAAKRCQG